MSLRSPDLDRAFVDTPIAHRGLHDSSAGIVENSRSAFLAAIEAGYGIELDVVEAACGTAVVFHDPTLRRLTGRRGKVVEFSATDLRAIPYLQGTDTISSFAEVLDVVAGRVPLLVELKDHDATFRSSAARLVADVAGSLRTYAGKVAVMGFNPDTVAQFAELDPGVPWGLTSCAANGYSLRIAARRRAELAALTEFSRLGASFVSHDRRDLDNPAVLALRQAGVPILCWTIRSAKDAARARQVADNITFEGFRP